MNVLPWNEVKYGRKLSAEKRKRNNIRRRYGVRYLLLPAILTWNNQHVSVLFPVVASMAARTVTDRETRSHLTDLLKTVATIK